MRSVDKIARLRALRLLDNSLHRASFYHGQVMDDVNSRDVFVSDQFLGGTVSRHQFGCLHLASAFVSETRIELDQW